MSGDLKINKGGITEPKELGLMSMNGGAVEDLFNEELGKVLRNIGDLNTDPEAVREICVRIKIAPSKDRMTAATLIQATSRLAPNVPVAGSAFFAFENNKPKAYTHNPNQMVFDGIKQ
jgi:hypothetical protein